MSHFRKFGVPIFLALALAITGIVFRPSSASATICFPDGDIPTKTCIDIPCPPGYTQTSIDYSLGQQHPTRSCQKSPPPPPPPPPPQNKQSGCTNSGGGPCSGLTNAGAGNCGTSTTSLYIAGSCGNGISLPSVSPFVLPPSIGTGNSNGLSGGTSPSQPALLTCQSPGQQNCLCITANCAGPAPVTAAAKPPATYYPFNNGQTGNSSSGGQMCPVNGQQTYVDNSLLVNGGCPPQSNPGQSVATSKPIDVSLNANVHPQDFPNANADCGTECCLRYAQAVRPPNSSTGIPVAGGDQGARNLLYLHNDASSGYMKTTSYISNPANLSDFIGKGWAVIFNKGAPMGADAAAHGYANADSTYGHIGIITAVNDDTVTISQAGLGTTYTTTMTKQELEQDGVYLMGNDPNVLTKIQAS